jgi:hypothetical protein
MEIYIGGERLVKTYLISSIPQNTDTWDETLLDNKVPDIKGTISAPAETNEAFAGHRVDKTVLYEEGWESPDDFRKVGRAINLFLTIWTQGCLDGGRR